ncbi:MAG: histidine kinase [Dechloromonas sp.]|nr:MAG: histidine kinase [Dechloromonas sp.]
MISLRFDRFASLCFTGLLCLVAPPSGAQDFASSQSSTYREARAALLAQGWRPDVGYGLKLPSGKPLYRFPEVLCGPKLCRARWVARAGQEKLVTLLRGEILVDVARDGARPFIVNTAHGSIRALGTRFLVSREDEATALSMIESRVEVRVDGSAAPLVVAAGQRLRFGPGGDAVLADVDGGMLEAAWQQRQLVVRDKPLADVLDDLARHRPGVIHYDRQAIAGKQVSAVLPADDTDRSLQLLANNFPGLRIRTLTPYLVIVDQEKNR